MRSLAKLASLVAVGLAVAVPSSAEAASTIRSPNPPQYKVEIEPHGIFAGDVLYYEGTTGFGAGVRFSIPLMSPGFIKTINDSIAISFGPDLVHFDSYRYNCGGGYCYNGTDFWRLYFPVAMQWNFWLTDKWSVFGEPGLVFRHDFVSDYCPPGVACTANGVHTIDFAFWAGARFHFSDRVALTMRVGFPEAFSIGVSFF
jgi:hypothetical protein